MDNAPSIPSGIDLVARERGQRPSRVPGIRRGPTVETILYLIIFLLAVTTRFALLDSQAMHHDEGIHTLYGWNIYQGKGYAHDAVYHGPLIYHAGALAFSLFGDSDSTARLAEVVLSIATVMLPLLLRRYLGRWGALLSCALLLISPTFLYFGRFARNDVLAGFWTLLTLVCIIRYIGERRSGWLYGAAAATCLNFCSKETAYIATALFLLYLGGRVVWERYGLHAFWPLLGAGPAIAETLWRAASQGTFPLPVVVTILEVPLSLFSLLPLSVTGLAYLGLLAWYWWDARRGREADPANVLIRVAKQPPIDYHSPNIPEHVVVYAMAAIGLTYLVAAVIGLLWDARRWAISAAIFWGIFFVLYTSLFSSMTGWATGLVQALGFWLSQQGVKRIHVGPQYYLMLMSVYEAVSFLFGTIGTVFFIWRGVAGSDRRERARGQVPADPAPPMAAGPGVTTGLLAFLAPAGFVIYSLAGEQVPWLNIHPTLPFVLMAGAFMGRVIARRAEESLEERPLRMGWLDGAFILLGLLAGVLFKLALGPEETGTGAIDALLWTDRPALR